MRMESSRVKTESTDVLYSALRLRRQPGGKGGRRSAGGVAGSLIGKPGNCTTSTVQRSHDFTYTRSQHFTFFRPPIEGVLSWETMKLRLYAVSPSRVRSTEVLRLWALS